MFASLTLPERWIRHLFKRFDEIYGVGTSNSIDKNIEHWQKVLHGINAEQIKLALDICKNDTSVIPTAEVFASLCVIGISDKEAPGEDKVKEDKPKCTPEEWRAKLLSMDDLTACRTLTAADQYDRTRLLIEKESNDRVKRYQAVANIPVSTPYKKTEIERRDWV